jgi:hypothetical protein
MKNDYGFDTKGNKIKLSAVALWMEFQHGEGELEIENQGRFRSVNSISFAQETEAIGQHPPRNGDERPMQRVLSAGCAENSDSTPQFFSHSAFISGARTL